jgi:glycosyltransferase involved in cell wall biosynthesis
MTPRKGPPKILIPLNTVSLYGMERSVIETFDLLRPEIDPHFLLSFTTQQLHLPVLAEIKRRGLSYSFFSDKAGWPRIGKPRSFHEGWKMAVAITRGNYDVLRAAHDKDVIYIPSVNYFFFAVLAGLRHRLLHKGRLVYQFHDLILKKSTLLRFVALFVTDFVHNTAFGYESVAKENPYLERNRNTIIPLVIAKTREDNEGDTERNLAGAFAGKRNILFIGQVAKHKGVDILLDAFHLLSESHNDLFLHLVGGCDDTDLSQALKQSFSNGCAAKHWGYREHVCDFLRFADIYVHPSPPSRFKESFGRGVVEAMAVGVPSVCFPSGALQEIVTHEGTGLVCHEETSECLAMNLKRFLVDEAFRKRCGKQASLEHAKRYSGSFVKPLWLSLIGES